MELNIVSSQCVAIYSQGYAGCDKCLKTDLSFSYECCFARLTTYDMLATTMSSQSGETKITEKFQNHMSPYRVACSTENISNLKSSLFTKQELLIGITNER